MINPGQVREKIENRLYRLGFSTPDIRRLLAAFLMLCAASFALGIVFVWLTLWPLAFCAGVVLSTFSLWHIARFAEANLRQGFSVALALRLFFSFNARLVLIGLALFALIVLLKAPLVPLLLGLSSTVAGIVLWGLSRFRKPVKEA